MNLSIDRRRGSVLIFAVVVLAILAMLSTAFLIVARHAIAASRSGLNSTQADLAADAGQYRLRAFLNASVKGVFTSSPDKVVYHAPPDGFSWSQFTPGAGPNQNSPLNMFGHEDFDKSSTILTPSFAVLSSVYPDLRYVDKNSFPTTPYYTSAPLRISARVQGDADRASAFFIHPQSNVSGQGFNDFYTGVNSNLRKQLPNIGTVRGQHFIWVRDLDGAFYANPALWGMNTSNIARDARTPQSIATAILDYLRTTPNSDLMGFMSPAEPAFIANQKSTEKYDNIGSFALTFPLHEPATANYLQWRALIENYFTPYLDTARNPDGSFQTNSQGTYISQYKPHPAAVNINTAPEEVIQALLSQIPFTDTQTFCQTGTPSMAENVAKRIIDKRPFLCRMDFEDFVASLLPDDKNSAPASNTDFPLGTVRYAITKRVDREIRLSQFMEVPGLPEGDYVDAQGKFVDFNPYKDSNTVQHMANRFSYFLLDDGSSVTRANAQLTVKAFNNLLNSVSSSPGPSLKAIQVVLPGTAVTPNTVVIDGNGGSLDGIHLGGDDVIVNGKVLAGPNGIAETEITGFSYYSHDYGGRVPNEYKPARLLTDPVYATLDPTSTKDCGKFIYGDPGASYVPASSKNGQEGEPGVFKNYFIADLQKWSCVGDGVLSGYYDMFFNPADGMTYEFAEKSTVMPEPSAGDPSIVSANSTPLRTGLKSDDVQQVDIGDNVIDTNDNFVVMLPGPNGKIETTPNKNNSVLAPGAGQPQPPQGDDLIVKAIRLSNYMGIPSDTGTDAVYAFSNDAYIYLVPAYGTTTLQSAPRPGDPTDPAYDPNDNDTLVDVIVDGGNGKSDTQIENDDVLDPATNVISVGPNLINETVVWGPIRGSQRGQDQLLASVADQIPTAQITSGSNGDVAWSLQICFRSRFFGTYVLAQGLITTPKAVGTMSAAAVGTNGPLKFTINDPNTNLAQVIVPGSYLAINSIPDGYASPQTHVYIVESFSGTGQSGSILLTTPLAAKVNAGDPAAGYTSKVSGERRVESTYDAYNDEILWSRSPLTTKRALGDPQ